MRILTIALACSALIFAGLPTGVATGLISSNASSLKVVFAAVARDPALRATGAQMLYTTGPRGADLRQVTSYDGHTYDWPAWAFGGTKIIYTRRSLVDPAAGENLFLMDADGSDPIQLTFSSWRNVQPKVSPDGRSVVFTAMWPEYPKVAIFKLDLATLTVVNLSSVGSDPTARGSDPRWNAVGSSIVFADTIDRGAVVPTQIYQMDAAGGGRRRLTTDSFWNTDPDISPDGARLAISSYRGPGVPHLEGAESEFAVKLQDWHLVVTDLATGKERVLTRGLPCATRVPPAPACSASEGPAWVPVWAPDGLTIGYLTVTNVNTMGIYAAAIDGTSFERIMEVRDLAITWWDWIDPKSAGSASRPVLGKRPSAALLIGGGREGREGVLIRTTPDRWQETAIVPVVPGLAPRFARWTRDRAHIVFSASRPHDEAERPTERLSDPARHVRYTLPDFTAESEHYPDQDGAEEQIYVMDAAGGNVRQLTTPWTEDPLEALREGDLGANIEPDISPDGRYVIFTNVSMSVDETMILRLDVVTGDVLNLSSMTAGALTVRDSAARFSPDGTEIVLSSTVGGTRQILVMRADGTSIRQVTNEDVDAFDPAWSPDGTRLVYAARRSDIDHATPTDGWSIVTLDLATGARQAITTPGAAFRPVWSPDGASIAYISSSSSQIQPDLRLIEADGRNDRLLVTLLTREAFVDWR